MPDYPEIFVLRHGQTEWNTVGRHQGRLDSPLTEIGREQALAQSRILANALAGRGDVQAHCSPQGRAFDTAGIILARLGQVAKADDRLCEIAFGDWEGLTIDEIADGWPEIEPMLDAEPFGWHFCAPGGETFDDICRRAQDFLRHLTSPSIIITHGITSRILRGLWLGVGQDEMAALEGGQGCVYHLKKAVQRRYPSA